MQAVVGGNVVYPNLQSIANKFRFMINDTANNTGGSGVGAGNGAGLIMPNTNPDLWTLMDEAIPELFSDLRNVGDPELIDDNYNLIGLPALQQSNPAVQVSLAYNGFFDGFQWHPEWFIPPDARRILAVRERQTGSVAGFRPMTPCPFGLPSGQQGVCMGFWEMRKGQIWMPGAMQQIDLQLRMRISFPTAISSTTNFQTTYVPILDSSNAIAAKMRIIYAARFAPDQYELAISEEDRLMQKLKLEVVRQMQGTENSRAEWANEATGDFTVTWGWVL